MKRSTKVTLVLLSGIALLFAGWVPCSRAADAGSNPQVSQTAGENNLTAEQRVQLKDVRQKYESLLAPLMKRYQAENSTLRQMTRAPEIDEAAIRAQYAKVTAIGADITVQRAHERHDMRAVLTPDQIRNLQQVGNDTVDARIDRVLSALAASERKIERNCSRSVDNARRWAMKRDEKGLLPEEGHYASL